MDNIRQEVIESFKGGRKIREIAEDFSLTMGRVKYYIYSVGKGSKERVKIDSVKRKWDSLPEKTKQRVRFLSKWGYTPKEIGQDQNIKSHIIHAIKERGLL